MIIIIAICMWRIAEKNINKLEKQVKSRLRNKILNSEIEEITYSTRNKYVDDDVHDLMEFYDIDFDCSKKKNLITGKLDGATFSYHEEFHISKKGALRKSFSGFVITLSNTGAEKIKYIKIIVC